MSFKVEYRRGTSGPAMFQRHVRFNVDIAAIGQHENKGERCPEVDILYAVTFVLIAGTLDSCFGVGSYWKLVVVGFPACRQSLLTIHMLSGVQYP